MPRGPPCGHPACPEPQDSGGQWYYIVGDHGQKVAPGANSVCKRPDCRRYFIMLGEKKKPGPKKSGDAKLTGNERTMPSNYIVKKVHGSTSSAAGAPAAPALLRSPCVLAC